MNLTVSVLYQAIRTYFEHAFQTLAIILPISTLILKYQKLELHTASSELVFLSLQTQFNSK